MSKSLLAQLSANNSPEANNLVLRKLADNSRRLGNFAARIRNSPTDDDDDDDAVSEQDNPLRDNDDNAMTDQERTRLASFEQWSDENLLPQFINTVTADIHDFASAQRALDYYNISWFTRQPLSNEGKQQLAAAIISRASEYLKNFNEFWRTLADGDATALSEVSFNLTTPGDQS